MILICNDEISTEETVRFVVIRKIPSPIQSEITHVMTQSYVLFLIFNYHFQPIKNDITVQISHSLLELGPGDFGRTLTIKISCKRQNTQEKPATKPQRYKRLFRA